MITVVLPEDMKMPLFGSTYSWVSSLTCMVVAPFFLKKERIKEKVS